MDYAKLAYLKAEDLEARIQKNSPSNTVTKINIGQTELQPGIPLRLAAVKGSGIAGIFVSLKFGAVQESAEIVLQLDGKRAGAEALSENVSFMASSVLDGFVQISICCDAAVKLIKADIMVIGDAAFTGGTAGVKLDSAGGAAGVIKIEPEGIYFYEIKELSNPLLDKGLLIGFGNGADICGYAYGGESVWAVAHNDTENNVFLSLIKNNGGNYELLKCVFLVSDAQSPTLMSVPDNSLVFGYIRDGVAYAGAVTADLILEGVSRIDSADTMDFIKRTFPPAVMVCGGGKNVLRISENELSTRDSIRLELNGIIA